MYNPARFKSENLTEAFELMEQYPFATVIMVVDGLPLVSHLPITPKMRDEKIELIGHLAKANPQWKSFKNSVATVIFHGAHTYITPKWYAENDVPTWNYSTAHVVGQVELIETYDGIIECLQELTAHVEKIWPSGWQFFVPDDLGKEILPKNIVGFKIKVDDINFKRKLSQNRSTEDRAGILKGLKSRTDENSLSVLKDMMKMYSINDKS